jgi:hypothetical protein
MRECEGLLQVLACRLMTAVLALLAILIPASVTLVGYWAKSQSDARLDFERKQNQARLDQEQRQTNPGLTRSTGRNKLG